MFSPEKSDIIDGRYRLDEKISQGGVGTIWRATQVALGREVALKLLRPEMSRLPQLRRRFAREARAASRLSHPNIAAIYDFGVDETSQMFIAMELIDGDPVTRCIETGLSLLNVLMLADLLLAGLAHAHARGVIHRDLKPSNVVLAGSSLPEKMGVPKLVDFGIARVRTETTSGRDTSQGEVVGTPRYMSPEQAGGDANLGAQTDLYNVGLILYELITGDPPFGEQKGLAVMSQHVHDPIPPMIARAGLAVPSELRNLVMRALSKDPRDRWITAAEFRRDLQPIIDQARRDPQAEEVPTPQPDGPNLAISEEFTLHTARKTLEETGVFDEHARTLVDRPDDGPGDMPGDVLDDVRDEVQKAALGPAFRRVPFVGRIAERERLMDIVERVRGPQKGCNVLISGEAGVGKTRLTMWLKEQCEEFGLLRAHLGAFTRGANGGLRGLHEVLASIFGTRGLAREEVAERVRWHLAEWGQSDSADAGAIIEFLRPAGHAADEQWQTRVSTSALFAAVTRILELASLYHPRLVILDDVHWAGSELAEFLDYLAVEMRHREFPLLVVSTIRTEDLAERPQLAAQLNALSRYTGESVERIELSRLGRQVSYKLVDAIVPCDDQLTAIVYERSAGNPLHLVLLLRYLREEGLLESDGIEFKARNLDEVREAMPPSLADLFNVRIEQVEQRLDTAGALVGLLGRAAVAGARFSFEVLERMLQLEADQAQIDDFDVHFDRLLAEGFVVELEGRGEDWYQFSHALLRDYLLGDGLGPGLLRKLHRLAARAMIDVLGARTESFALEIAGHWRAGARPDKALAWYRRGAEALRRSAMYRQAASTYEVCVELMDSRLGVGPDSGDQHAGDLPSLDDDERFEHAGLTAEEYLDTLVRLGELLEGFGEFDRAETAFRRVVRMVGKDREGLDKGILHPLGQGWLGLGHIAWQRGDFEAADWAFEKVRGLVADQPSLESVDEQALLGSARVCWHRGEYERARKLANLALESASQRGWMDAEAESLWLLGEVERMLGDGEAAREFYDDSLELYRKAEQPAGIARNLLSMAQLARYQKAFGEAGLLYGRALSRYETLGDRRGAGRSLSGLGDIARFEDRYDQARTHYTRALDIFEAIGAEYDVALVYTNLGLTAMARADYEAADEYLSAAGTMVTGDEYPYLLAGIDFNLALVKSLRGDEAQSEAILDDVLELSERFPIPDLDYAQPLERLGRLRAEAGDTGEAVELWQKAAAIYRELQLSDDLQRVQDYIQRVATK